MAEKFLPLPILLWVSNQEENSQPEYRVPRSCVTSTKLQLHKPCQVGAGRMTSSAKPRASRPVLCRRRATNEGSRNKRSPSPSPHAAFLHSLTHSSPFILHRTHGLQTLFESGDGHLDVAGASSNRSNGGGQMAEQASPRGHCCRDDRPCLQPATGMFECVRSERPPAGNSSGQMDIMKSAPGGTLRRRDDRPRLQPRDGMRMCPVRALRRWQQQRTDGYNEERR